MHDYIGFGTVLLAVLAGIFLNNKGIDRLDARIDKLDAKIDKVEANMVGRIDRVQADLTTFNRELGEHKAIIDRLERPRKQA